MLGMNWLGTRESSSDPRYRNSETHRLRSLKSKAFMLRRRVAPLNCRRLPPLSSNRAP
jgi:hypothetical protein